MIFVDRSAVPVPEVFTSSRMIEERDRVYSLLRNASQEHLDQLRVTFDDTIWKQAREVAMQLFYGKCAFCESRIDITQRFGDLEHFRPKHSAQDLEGRKGAHLHYAWLVYEWDNLLIVCAACNRPHTLPDGTMAGKWNRFPVRGARAPFLSSVAECRATEDALLIDPTFDQPSEHLVFDPDTGLCAGLTEKGTVTIQLLGLNREGLIEERRRAARYAHQIVAMYVGAVARGEDADRAGLANLQAILGNGQPYLAVVREVVNRSYEKIRRELTLPAAAELGIREPIAAAPRIEIKVPQRSGGIRAPQKFEKRRRLPTRAQQRIQRIEIRNFGTIESLDFDFADAYSDVAASSSAAELPEDGSASALMILGENASGKSTVLEAVALALLGTSQIKKLSLRAEDVVRRTRWDMPVSETTLPAEVRIFFEGAKDKPVELTADARANTFSGTSQPSTVLLGYGPRRFFADLGSFRRRSSQAHARVETLFKPLAVIANPNDWLMTCPPDMFSLAVRALRQILMLPDDAIVRRPEDGGGEIRFEVQGIVAPLSRLSDGYKTIVATSVDIMREMLRYWPDLANARGVVLIDELEAHLHPRWKMRIVQRLRRAMPQVQFIATTHDPLCLRGMYDGEVQVLSRDDQFNVERIVDVPNVRGLSVEQLLTSDCFGLFSTEDPAFDEEVTRYVALATKRQRTAAEERELERHREIVKERMVVGATPEAQMIQEAMSRYLLDRRTKRAGARASLKRESIADAVKLWNSLPAGNDAK